MDWLEQQGYTKLGIVGTSLGSCYAFIAAAHDPRIAVNVFNHASTTFGDVVWTGQSTRHIRKGMEGMLNHDQVRDAWMCISPMAYFQKFHRWPKKSLMIYGRYDLTFLPEFSMQAAGEFLKRGLDTTIKALPCGHYTLGETPYKYMDAWHISRFLAKPSPDNRRFTPLFRLTQEIFLTTHCADSNHPSTQRVGWPVRSATRGKRSQLTGRMRVAVAQSSILTNCF